VPYEQRYCDANSESKNYHIKKRRRHRQSYGEETGVLLQSLRQEDALKNYVENHSKRIALAIKSRRCIHISINKSNIEKWASERVKEPR